MQLMERVRELGADQAPLAEDSVRGARQALTQEMARSARPGALRRSSRRRWASVGIGGLVAGTAVAAIVAGSVLTPPALPNAVAAEVLERAADVTMSATDTTLAAGQYLRIENHSEHLQFWSAQWADDGDDDTFSFNIGRDGADAAVLVRGAQVLYVPADRSADWVYSWSANEVVRSFGDRGADAVKDWERFTKESSSAGGGVETLPAGQFLAEGGDVPPMPYLADSYRPYYDEMPREPAELLTWLLARSGMTGSEAERWLVASLSDPSSINLMPTELRASFFRAIALIPGFEVTSRDGDLVGLRYAVPEHRTTTLVIDTTHGLVESIAESFGSGGPTGDLPETVTRVSVTVVDSVP